MIGFDAGGCAFDSCEMEVGAEAGGDGEFCRRGAGLALIGEAPPLVAVEGFQIQSKAPEAGGGSGERPGFGGS